MNQEWLKQLPISSITNVTPVSGGDINEAFKVTTTTKDYFLLVQPNQNQQFYQHEIEGLKLLSQAALVPQVIASGQIEGDAYLLLSWLESGRGSQSDLGQLVAHVHQIHHDRFGFDHDVDGKLPKINTWQTNWGEFYVHQRLEVLAKRASDHGLWNQKRQNHFQRLCQIILDYYQTHDSTPSLLHGDLWAGNVMFTADGKPALIDPDVLYGDREFDLAMTTVFGGFSEQFYQGYNDTYPIAAGFQERLPWYQLYYLMAHLNLFGESYGGSVDRILSAY
ncbi:fructosamine kinase family protein [Secundilactobacillus folii]|uniref:Phosphotransferase n=1 Tax=Secundilactobacillus folii TaxID=2678357 RepID=A0A7X2XTA1_9LACO|nr:fructosamine kinase family protein [Secundilactobacillus folii]MTV81263.1 phosphotransferase [Secundilactobacillus folii]